MPRNPARRDYFQRAVFRVLSEGHTLCRLMVGKNLADLCQRSTAIAKACPEITVRPLFWHQADGWDYFATEFFEGENLESLVLGGQMTVEEALSHAERIVSVLEESFEASSLEDASRELEQLFDRVSALPLFGGLDQPFLDHIVFPPVQTGALAEVPKTRWTNGDLIARNILVDPLGHARLIDYEFAERTHFYAIDGWRWRKLSVLPPEARLLPRVTRELQTKPWLESLSILKQLALLYEINGAQMAVEDMGPALERLMTLSARSQFGVRASAFLRAIAAESPLGPRKTRVVTAQLYWSHDGNHAEAQSCRVEYATGIDEGLTFLIPQVRGRLKLRLDPSDAPGLLQISAIRLHNAQRKRTFFSLNQSTGWDRILIIGGLLRLPDSPSLNLLSLDRDPHFYLPDVNIGEMPCDLVVDLWLHFSPELTQLPSLLSAPGESPPPAA